MSFRDRIRRSRQSLSERMNLIFNRGPQLDEDFWDDLEETLILSDLGGAAAMQVVENLREQATRKALPDAYAVLDMLADEIASLFTPADPDPFTMNPVCVLFVGINGAGKTTTVGKLANQATIGGRKVLVGSADTFRAAAIEQLDVWGKRSGVEVVKRERGADPASVCYDVCARAEEVKSDLVLIDTSGRLHTSDELMRELQKVVNVTRKRADMDVKVVLVVDATTGQNGLNQAREFNAALELDGVIMTKLDGTAKGGIAVAISHELGLPICRVGVGEGIEDLQPFVAREYAQALFGSMRDGEFEEGLAERAAESEEEADEAIVDGSSDDVVEGAADEIELAEEEAVENERVEEVVESESLDDEAATEGEPAVDIVHDEEPEDSVETEPAIDFEQGVEAEPAVEDGDFEVETEVEAEKEAEAEEEGESEDEAPKKESFRDKMRRWFS